MSAFQFHQTEKCASLHLKYSIHQIKQMYIYMTSDPPNLTEEQLLRHFLKASYNFENLPHPPPPKTTPQFSPCCELALQSN